MVCNAADIAGALVLAFLACTAGCSGVTLGGGPGVGTPTVTPAPVPTAAATPTVERPPAPPEYPWLGTQAAVLSNTSYTTVRRVSVSHPNGTRIVVRERRLSVAAGGVPYYRVDTATGRDDTDDPDRVELWVDEERVAIRSTTDGETQFTAISGESHTWAQRYYGPGRNTAMLLRLATVVSLSRSGTTPDGKHVYQGHLADAAGVDWLLFGRSPQNLTVTVLAGDRLARQLTARYTAVVDDRRVSVALAIRYEAVGTTWVERPAWYDRAVNGSDDPTPDTRRVRVPIPGGF